MANRDDISVDFSISPRIITVAAPSTEIITQALYDTLRKIEAQPENMDDKILIKANTRWLSGGALEVVSYTLQNAKLSFETRPGPSFVECRVIGGDKLLAVDANNSPIDPIRNTDFTKVVKEETP